MLSFASADANKQLQHHTSGRRSLLFSSSSNRASTTTSRSVSVAAASVLWLLVAAGRQSCPSSTTTTWQANAEATHSKHHDNAAMHPPVYVDTKYWIRSTEFGERDNWIQQLRPCSLAERIKMNEQSVVSMGSSMDALGGSLLNANFIKELTLAENGMLLLEEDLPEDPIDSAFVDYLKAIGDCADGETASADGDTQTTTRRRLFEFQPDSDEMSWFNPENWASTPNEYNIEEWIPESHQVPCSDDVVVFGDRHNMLETFLELGERDKTASFKVNFRPSSASFKEAEGELEAFAKADSLRVSKLRIGDRHYDQQQFEKLVYSSDYSDILFQFNDSKSVLARQDGYMGNPLLTIDESSLVRDTSENICLDEAGCLCGNERAETMKVICSFHEPLSDDDLPCHDPIYSAGHCNKICATSLTISMEPSRFSERFINSIIEKIMKDDSRAGSVLVGPRRIDDDKYEILFRYIPNEEEHWSSAGIELDYAKLVLQQLERGSTKSFYGIRTITTRSSRQWRRNNRSLIFWLTSATLSLISVAVIVRKEADAELRFGIDSALETQGWLNNIWDQTRQKAGSLEVNSGSSMRLTDELERTGDNYSESLTNIPLLDLDEDDTEKNSR